MVRFIWVMMGCGSRFENLVACLSYYVLERVYRVQPAIFYYAKLKFFSVFLGLNLGVFLWHPKDGKGLQT